MSHRYLHVDVFTDRQFEGNQLAVFPRPDGLSAETMQRIANEMNFSETTFVLPPEKGGDARMRIFTPSEELPMAGHPTIGTTFVLAAEGIIRSGREQFVFELGVGPVPVALEWNGDALAFAWMTQPLPTFGGIVEDRAAFAAAVGLQAADLTPDLPIQSVSCGVPFLFVPIATRAAVDAVSIERKALARCCRDAGLSELPVFFFTSERGPGPETVYSRMLAPGCGPLGCYLLRHGAVSAGQATALLSLQGVAMGRPSRIHISIDSRNGDITRVRIGGESVLVGEGVVRLAAVAGRAGTPR
jgi:trans-2,3-dihydro-3-hydroxyanthranilate isomerase